jgi:hypothetical protein
LRRSNFIFRIFTALICLKMGKKNLITVDVDKSEKYYIDYEDKIAIWLLIKRINSDMFLKQITFVHKKMYMQL